MFCLECEGLCVMKRQFILEIETDDEEYTFDDLLVNVSHAVADMVHPCGYYMEMREIGELKGLLNSVLYDKEDNNNE